MGYFDPKPTRVITEEVVGCECVDGVNIDIVRLTWNDGSLSFDVLRHYDGEVITMDESFDAYPTQEQLDDLLREKGYA